MNKQQELPSDLKVRWQCRRGMLELDILLLAFFDKAYQALSQVEKRIFIELLTFSDPELYGWLIGKVESPLTFRVIVQQIRNISWKK